VTDPFSGAQQRQIAGLRAELAKSKALANQYATAAAFLARAMVDARPIPNAGGHMAIPLAANSPLFLGADDSFTPSITDAAFHATQSATVIDRVRLLNTATTPVNVLLKIFG